MFKTYGIWHVCGWGGGGGGEILQCVMSEGRSIIAAWKKNKKIIIAA